MSKQTNENHTLMRLANSAKDYQQLGIDPVIVKSFEDGMRMDGAEGTYEWWYFDAHLDNGAKMVVVFFTKPYTMPHLPLSPFIRLNIELPDGRSIQKIKTFDAKDFSSSRETCDVKIGDNRFYGDLQHYSIQAELDEVSVDVQLEGQISPWRPKSGHMYYGKKKANNYSLGSQVYHKGRCQRRSRWAMRNLAQRALVTTITTGEMPLSNP
ncbi:hypothetical protein GTW56_30475 [Bacillus sp. EB93]|nr:hypothetical protein [Peribacillus frigoritolerans]